MCARWRLAPSIKRIMVRGAIHRVCMDTFGTPSHYVIMVITRPIGSSALATHELAARILDHTGEQSSQPPCICIYIYTHMYVWNTFGRDRDEDFWESFPPRFQWHTLFHLWSFRFFCIFLFQTILWNLLLIESTYVAHISMFTDESRSCCSSSWNSVCVKIISSWKKPSLAPAQFLKFELANFKWCSINLIYGSRFGFGLN